MVPRGAEEFDPIRVEQELIELEEYCPSFARELLHIDCNEFPCMLMLRKDGERLTSSEYDDRLYERSCGVLGPGGDLPAVTLASSLPARVRLVLPTEVFTQEMSDRGLARALNYGIDEVEAMYAQ